MKSTSRSFVRRPAGADSLFLVAAAIVFAGCVSQPKSGKEIDHKGTVPLPPPTSAAPLPTGGVTQTSSAISGSGYQNGQISCVLPTGVSDVYHTMWAITPGAVPSPSAVYRDVRCPTPYNPGWMAPGPYVVSFRATGARTPAPFRTRVAKGRLNTLTVRYR